MTREIAGETILVPIRHGVGDLSCIFTLNETGSFVWRMLDGKNAVGNLVTAVCGEFGISVEEATRDVRGFLGELEAAGLVRPTGSQER